MADVHACDAELGVRGDVRGTRRAVPRGEGGFELMGHECPYGAYPAPVIPIGRLGGKFVAIYPGGSAGPAVEEIPEDAEYVKHGDELRIGLERFNFRVHLLFGFSEARVEYYPASNEAEFLKHFLGTDASDGCNPAVRRMLEEHLRRIARPVNRLSTRAAEFA